MPPGAFPGARSLVLLFLLFLLALIVFFPRFGFGCPNPGFHDAEAVAAGEVVVALALYRCSGPTHSPHSLHTRLLGLHSQRGEVVPLVRQIDSIPTLASRAPGFDRLSATVPVDGFKTLFAIFAKGRKMVAVHLRKLLRKFLAVPSSAIFFGLANVSF